MGRTTCRWRTLLAAAAIAALSTARELDPAACAARFDVQRDKIIRTEESRDMGARYLSELDVGSRQECRRLCCETDACDVFVYEEKSPGSCYLFNCGPPEDFRCKFTAHSNFSSGVLALSRRLAELQDQERLAPPLPQLVPHAAAAPAPPAPDTRAHSTTSAAAATTAAAAPAPPPPAPPRPPRPPRPAHAAPDADIHTPTQGRCSRYQWECHTGGECIAVYNACDGVPQCADGSDEAPELGCPAAAAPAPPAPPRPPPAPAAPASPSTRAPLLRQPQPPPQPYSPQVFESETSAVSPERWPHRLLQAQQPRRYPAPDAESNAPHIFSHKGGLVQEQAFESPAAASEYSQPWPRRPWAPHQGMESGPWGGWAREWGDGDGRAWGPPAPPEPPAAPAPPLLPAEREPSAYLSSDTMPEMPVLYPQRRPPHDQPKKGLGLASPEGGPQPAAAAAPAPGTTAPAAAAVPSTAQPPLPAAAVLQQQSHVGAGAAAVADDHDGLSERPPAAVVLLVLGVCMAGALGAGAGCRARAAARRRRRGTKALAHDADYLVNGMYL